MKIAKKIVKSIITTVLLVCLSIVFGNSMHAYATSGIEDNGRALLYVVGYEVTNSTITPYEDFTLTVKLQNYSKTKDATNVVVVVSNPSGVIPEYGTVTSAYIESIGPDETIEIPFDYTADGEITSSQLSFKVEVRSDTSSSAADIRVPVGRDTDFTTESCDIPSRLEVGKDVYASAVVSNVSLKGVRNVVMIMRVDGEDIASENIGTMSANTSKTQNVRFTIDEVGTKKADLVLTYTDSEGSSKEYVITSGKITAIEEVEEIVEIQTQDSEEETIQSVTNNSQYTMLIGSGALLVIICISIIIILARRK